MDGEHDDDHEAYVEHDFTFDVDSGHYLNAPRRPRRGAGGGGWSLVGRVIALALCVGGLTVVGVIAFFLISLNSWGSNK